MSTVWDQTGWPLPQERCPRCQASSQLRTYGTAPIRNADGSTDFLRYKQCIACGQRVRFLYVEKYDRCILERPGGTS